MDDTTINRFHDKLTTFYHSLDADEQSVFATMAGAGDDVSGYAETVHLYFRSAIPTLLEQKPTSFTYQKIEWTVVSPRDSASG